METVDLTPEQRQALDAAESILRNSYNPYSSFAVGACLVMKDRTPVVGTNVENAAYGSTICAERAALLRANAEGMREFRGIAIIGRGQASGANSEIKADSEAEVTGPCGSCRQMLYEFAEVGENDPWVVLSTPDRQKIEVTTVRKLLPYGFGPRNLSLDVSRWKR